MNRVRTESRGPTTAHLLRRLEGERDDGRLEIQQLRSECDSLRERLQVMREGREKEEVEEEQEMKELLLKIEEVSDQWTDRLIDGWTDRWMDRWIDEWTDGLMLDGLMD